MDKSADCKLALTAGIESLWKEKLIALATAK